MPGGRAPRRQSSVLRLHGSSPQGGGGLAFAPGARRLVAPHTLRGSSQGRSPRERGLLGHLADHVVEDAPVVEIGELHVGVKPHDRLEGLPGIQLQQ